jgi:hypothetical protein
MLAPGREAKVQAPSEDSFLRVHLPSGRVVTLTDERGKLNRLVSQSAIDAAQGTIRGAERRSIRQEVKTLDTVRSYHKSRSLFSEATPRDATATSNSVQLIPEATVRIFKEGVFPVPGNLNIGGDEASWEIGLGNLGVPPARLEIDHPWGRFWALLPGNTRTAYVRADHVREGESLLISVRLATTEPATDTILSYLERGDLYAAETMVTWVREAEQMLADKMEDPYSAAVGAYLLLKLRNFERLHTWARNLADRFRFLPDGSIIWAWQQIHQNPSNEIEIREYLLKAAALSLTGSFQGLPVYSQGLRLLIDGLRMLSEDEEVQEAWARLRRISGAVVWDSPITAGCKLDRSGYHRMSPVIYDVSFISGT